MMLVDVERGRAEGVALAEKLEYMARSEVEEDEDPVLDDQDFETEYQHQ